MNHHLYSHLKSKTECPNWFDFYWSKCHFIPTGVKKWLFLNAVSSWLLSLSGFNFIDVEELLCRQASYCSPFFKWLSQSSLHYVSPVFPHSFISDYMAFKIINQGINRVHVNVNSVGRYILWVNNYCRSSEKGPVKVSPFWMKSSGIFNSIVLSCYHNPEENEKPKLGVNVIQSSWASPVIIPL